MRPLRRLAGFGFAVNGVYRRHGQSRTGWHSAADPFGVWGRRVVAGLTCRRRQAQSQQALGAAATAARSALPFASDGRGTRSGLASNSNEAVSDRKPPARALVDAAPAAHPGGILPIHARDRDARSGGRAAYLSHKGRSGLMTMRPSSHHWARTRRLMLLAPCADSCKADPSCRNVVILVLKK